MNRFASTRSEKRASHPGAGRAQCRVGSIDDDGIRYGLTTQALIASTIATAPTIVTIQSTAIRARFGSRPVTRSSGWWNSSSPPSDDGGQENGGAGGGSRSDSGAGQPYRAVALRLDVAGGELALARVAHEVLLTRSLRQLSIRP